MNFLQDIKKKTFLQLHIALWLLIVLLPLIKNYLLGYQFNLLNEVNEVAVSLVIFYTTLWGLIKIRVRWVLAFGLLLLYVAMSYIHFNIHDQIFGGKHFLPFYKYSFGYFTHYLLLSLVAFAFYALAQKMAKEKQLHDTEKALHITEIAQLKAQLDPHFLFNTLNMIYSNALKKDAQTPELILKLSDNMRYLFSTGQLHETNLEDEIVHLRNYISLQKERLINKANIQFEYEIDNPDQAIPPMIFIPLVENAFKFTGQLEGNNHPIKIQIALRDGQLRFLSSNPMISDSTTAEKTPTGLGIANTRRRLEFHFPNKHQFQIHKGKTFDVQINIAL